MTSSSDTPDTKTLDDVLDGHRFAMVGTADGDTWKSRPLALAGQSGTTLSFLVSVEADWVAALETSGSPTTVTFSDPGKNSYVALQGSARTVDDQAKLEELWNAGAAAYFDGKDDPSTRVLEVSVSYGEYWDGPGGRIGAAINVVTAALGHSAGEKGTVET